MVGDFEGSREVGTHHYGDGCPEAHGKHRLDDGCPGGHRGVSTARECPATGCERGYDLSEPVQPEMEPEGCATCNGTGTITPCPKCDGILEIDHYVPSTLIPTERSSMRNPVKGGPLTHWRCPKCTHGGYT